MALVCTHFCAALFAGDSDATFDESCLDGHFKVNARRWLVEGQFELGE